LFVLVVYLEGYGAGKPGFVYIFVEYAKNELPPAFEGAAKK